MIRFQSFETTADDGQQSKGSLIAVEFSRLPFSPQRTFVVFGVRAGLVRGEHAHKLCDQVLTCISGTVRVDLDDGVSQESHILATPGDSVQIPPMVWGKQMYSGPDASVVVFASLPYAEEDYIDDYEEFLRHKKSSPFPRLPGSSE